ncbi:hypothetical protein CK203_065988 [Vitis vinifera]|uniref:Retrotransposon gag domain-containing protein n=1 Tax=Vitis vinifera TaxID=29760 RepID=A0A438G248_VITVI|nr:hypothetical protein CK203_065988 [Vitis vinifera]
MPWLINSMINDIGENFLLYGTTKEIWDTAKETYCNNENTSKLLKIESILHHLYQGDMSMTQYFNTLTHHWQQLDMFKEHDWDYPEDGISTIAMIMAKKGRSWCDHYRRPGHPKETCWKIHGKPADWKPTRPSIDKESHGNLVSIDGNSTPSKPSLSSKEQLKVLQKTFNQSQQARVTSEIGTRSIKTI